VDRRTASGAQLEDAEDRGSDFGEHRHNNRYSVARGDPARSGRAAKRAASR
jgi:hypothetical protein